MEDIDGEEGIYSNTRGGLFTDHYRRYTIDTKVDYDCHLILNGFVKKSDISTH